jgi:hypothetical protein
MAKEKIRTPIFRVSFPAVFTPQAFEQNKPPEYSVTMLFPVNVDLTDMRRIAYQAAVDRWGADKVPPNLRNPFRNGAEKIEMDGYDGNIIFVRAKSKVKPPLVDGSLSPIVEPSQFYAGCYAIAMVTAYAYGGSGTSYLPGVAFGLQSVQKYAEGEPFGVYSDPTVDFAPLDSEDPSSYGDPGANQFQQPMAPPAPQGQQFQQPTAPPAPQGQQFQQPMAPPAPQGQQFQQPMAPPAPQGQQFQQPMAPPAPQGQQQPTAPQGQQNPAYNQFM